MTWSEFLTELKARGGSTDMQTSKTGRYPWLFHFCRGQAAELRDVVIYASTSSGVLTSPSRDWSTELAIKADYRALSSHGGSFNDTQEVVK